MATIADIRKQYPQYNDLSDEQLARGFHSKFYNDMPYEEFASKIGVGPRSAVAPTPPRTPVPAAPAEDIPQPSLSAGDPAAGAGAYVFGRDTFKGLGSTIAERIKQIGYGYVLNRADEAAKLFEGTEGDDRQKLAAVTNEYLQKLKESDARIQAATPQDLNMLEQGIRSGVESIAVATPGLAAAYVTKSPYPAIAAAGLQTKFGSYGSARAEGLDPRQAELYANIDGALEAATEFLPAEFLMKSLGAKSLKGVRQELVKFALGEGAGEQVATATQSLNAYLNGLDKELEQAKDWKEAARIQGERQAVTALATIVAGSVFGGGAAALGKYQERAVAKQAEEDRRVADVAETYRRGAEQIPLGERPEDIPTRRAPPVAPETEAVTTPTVPETEAAAPTAPVEPAVPQGTASIEDLLGLADEEGPPEYTDADVPAFVRGEEKAAPAVEKKAPEVRLPEPAQLTLPDTEVPPAEDLVQSSKTGFPRSYDLSAMLREEVPSELAGPSAEETVGGAGVRGTELPVSRPGAEGRSVEEPAGAGVGLPPSYITGAAARTEAAKPPLKKKSMGIVGQESPEALESLRRAEQDESIPTTDSDSIIAPEWNELPNGFAYRQYKIVDVNTGKVSPVQEIRAPYSYAPKDEPAIVRRGLDTNGQPFGEIEATGTLDDVLSGRSFEDFNRYFAGDFTLEAPVAPEAPKKTAPIETTEGMLARDRRESFEKNYLNKDYPPLQNANALLGEAEKIRSGISKLGISLDLRFRGYPKRRWKRPSGPAKEVAKSLKVNARYDLISFLQSAMGSKKKTLPALVNDFHAMLDRQQKEAVALLDRVDPDKNILRPEIGVELAKSIEDFSNIGKAIEETSTAWFYATNTIKNIKAAQEQRAQKTAPASSGQLFSITPQNVADVWANPAFAPRAPGFKPRVKQIVGSEADPSPAAGTD
ncbi:hypothetical protein EBZ39_06295 [bacterium]|nr:hypothetical protein [bacterium]